MKPIPVVFHIGPLQVHTYGIGLALTFWFGFTYFERRLRKNGYRSDWFVPVFLWIIFAAVVGARALHVLTNLSYYTANPGDVFAIWHGGLSSFGGLLFAVPTGIVLTRRRCPELPLGRALDLAVPVFQALEDFAVYLVLIAIERRLNRWPDGRRRAGYPPGIVLGVAMVLWGIERSLDEHLWLGEDGRLGSDLVQLAGILLVAGGIVVLLRTRARWLNWLRTHHAGGPPATRAAQGDGAAAVDALEDAEHRT